jgi:preprotein translocase subunit SecD
MIVRDQEPMLQFTRIQAAAILLTIFVICGFTVPNFVSDATMRGWPDWARGRIVLASELQGGTSMLFEVDSDDAVREYILDSVFRDVRDALRDARIHLVRPLANPVTVRSGSVEVRPLTDNFAAALAKLREQSRTFYPVDVTDAGGGLIRVTPTEAGIKEYEKEHEPRIVEQSIRNMRERLCSLRTSIEREGTYRLRVRMLWPEMTELDKCQVT